MKPETIDTITRHLKGIVAALEKEKEPDMLTFKGKKKKPGEVTYLTEEEFRQKSNVIYK